MRILIAESERHAQLWEDFVARTAGCGHYHRWGWKRVIENSFGWPTFYMMGLEGDLVKAILPLVWQKSRLFGSFLTSLPFLNGGGGVGEDNHAAEALTQEAIALTQRLGANYLELRHRRPSDLGLPVKTNKVAVVHEVTPDEEKAWQSLPHKVRTDIRKCMKSELTAEFRGEEALDTFHEIFAENMRNLGTPAYGRNFFLQMLRIFPADTHICIVRHQGKPVAGSFLTGFRDTLEAGWSSSRYEYLAIKPNMFLYWKILRFAGERGYRTFDFGRSTVGSGTHRFKMQWGSKEIQLYWTYWLPSGSSLPELNPQNPRYRLAIWLWKRLPLAFTKLVGPRIVRCLP